MRCFVGTDCGWSIWSDLDIHGGSLRLYVQRRERERPVVAETLAEETRLGMATAGFYAAFGQHVRQLRDQIRAMLLELRNEKQSIAAYGAAAKGTIMLNYLGADQKLIDFVVDRNIHKHGRYMPGVHLPIRPVKALCEEMPNYTLMLAWNFRHEILAQQEVYRQRGGRFIIPVPEVTVL